MPHTPGPWYTSGEAGDAFDISTELPDENGECEHVIATVWANRPSLPDAADDARLIAAAPELLAVCNAIASDLGLLQFTDGEYRLSEQSAGVILHSLRQVIAKAEGRE